MPKITNPVRLDCAPRHKGLGGWPVISFEVPVLNKLRVSLEKLRDDFLVHDFRLQITSDRMLLRNRNGRFPYLLKDIPQATNRKHLQIPDVVNQVESHSAARSGRNVPRSFSPEISFLTLSGYPLRQTP